MMIASYFVAMILLGKSVARLSRVGRYRRQHARLWRVGLRCWVSYVNESCVYLLEIEAAQELQALMIVFIQLDLDEGEELFLNVFHDEREKESADALLAIGRIDLEIEDADRGTLPAEGEDFHFPDEGACNPAILLPIVQDKL